jgi:hypothetical protein
MTAHSADDVDDAVAHFLRELRQLIRLQAADVFTAAYVIE